MARPKIDNSPLAIHYRAVLSAKAMCEDWRDDPTAHSAALSLYFVSVKHLRDHLNTLLEVAENASTNPKSSK